MPLVLFLGARHLFVFSFKLLEGAALSVHYLKIYTEWYYMPLVLFLGARYLFVFSFKLLQIYPRFPLNSKLFGFRILLA